jgi:hypothetical protein
MRVCVVCVLCVFLLCFLSFLLCAPPQWPLTQCSRIFIFWVPYLHIVREYECVCCVYVYV